MVVRRNPFRELRALGYQRLVPIVQPGAPLSRQSTLYQKLKAGHDARGKVPGICNENGLWHGFDWQNARPDLAQLDAWNAMGAGIGIRTGDLGDGTSLVAIDADTLDPATAEIIRRQLTGLFGTLPMRIGQPPKALYVVRVEGVVPYSKLDLKGKERVELLTDGKQFVAYGLHPQTEKPYRWINGLGPLRSLPVYPRRVFP